jgi:hypothetical protein
MKLQRRRFLHLVFGAAALPVLPRAASALDYPARPVRIVVPYPAGITLFSLKMPLTFHGVADSQGHARPTKSPPATGSASTTLAGGV